MKFVDDDDNELTCIHVEIIITQNCILGMYPQPAIFYYLAEMLNGTRYCNNYSC